MSVHSKYFKLMDDKGIEDRWHLGEILTESGDEPEFDSAKRVDLGREGLVAKTTRVGRALDFAVSSFNAPVAARPLAEAMARVAPHDVQLLPVRVGNGAELMVVNALRSIPCLDERESEFLQWTETSRRPDLAGRYRQVTKLVLERDSIPPDAHLFRVDKWEVCLVVSQRMKAAMEAAGCSGAKFMEVPVASSS